MMAASLISVIPVLTVFLIFPKQFVQGLHPAESKDNMTGKQENNHKNYLRILFKDKVL